MNYHDHGELNPQEQRTHAKRRRRARARVRAYLANPASEATPSAWDWRAHRNEV